MQKQRKNEAGERFPAETFSTDTSGVLQDLKDLVCWTRAGSTRLLYWSPGGQLTSLTGPDPGSPSARLSADDRRIVGIQPQGSPSLIPRGINFTCMCVPLSSGFIFYYFFTTFL